jgi:hypothetical protein
MKRPKFITLTIPNVYRVTRKAVKDLRAAFSKLRRRKLFEGVRGGIYAIEVTPGNSLGWNLHLHAIIDGPYIPQGALSKTWGKLWGRESLVTYIQEIRGMGRMKRYVTKLTREIVKGLVDGEEGDLRPIDPWVLKNVRLIQGFGSMYPLPKVQKADIVCSECGSRVHILVSSYRHWRELWETLDRPPPGEWPLIPPIDMPFIPTGL